MKIEIKYRHEKKFIKVDDRIINLYGQSSNGKTFFLTKMLLAKVKIDDEIVNPNSILYINKLSTNYLNESDDSLIINRYAKRLIIIDDIDDMHRLSLVNRLIDELPYTVFIIVSRCFIRENVSVYRLCLTNPDYIIEPLCLKEMNKSVLPQA